MDVGCGHHGLIAWRPGSILDALADPSPAFVEPLPVSFSFPVAVAFLGRFRDSGGHSKASVSWNSEDVFLPQLFQRLRGFSSFFRTFPEDSPLDALSITLG
jgi:hypothetical protein